jgi:hypothetical protein
MMYNRNIATKYIASLPANDKKKKIVDLGRTLDLKWNKDPKVT